MTIANPAQILQIVREPLKQGQDDAYRAIEEETARISVVEGCPHPYLAAESLTGTKEIWWFNGYRSAAEQRQIADAYASNTRLLSSLQRQSARKSVLTLKPIELVATYRPEMSGGTPWTVGHGRFLVIRVTTHPRERDGTVFETLDHTYLGRRKPARRPTGSRSATPSSCKFVRPSAFPRPNGSRLMRRSGGEVSRSSGLAAGDSQVAGALRRGSFPR